MAGALTLAFRNERMEVTTAYGIDLNESSCELCGGCIRVCPAGGHGGVQVLCRTHRAGRLTEIGPVTSMD